ncbi:ribonuclease J [Candidatus Hepatoplasma crinochetorum]|uniref:ribonuclease J n=1 Tax=Candidatus Hepatoplasma crinochetorum TaxID=295596 RepID=UPI00308EAE1F|nr:MAG: ribonuclease J [Candidatus Hepatoplasma crinochetorum]
MNDEDKNESFQLNLKKIPPMYVYALGGLGEVGKNMYIVEQGNELWIIDSGIMFAAEISVEGVIPSFEWLEKNQKRIKGLIITHGHEDHIGSIPHLLNSVDIPKIYAGRIAANLIWSKLSERQVPRQKIEIINNKSVIKTLNFKIDFFNVNHSIPDCFGARFKSKHGTVVTTADFKFDFTPVGAKADLYKMASFGNEGVTLLLSDSTNAQSEKFSISEKQVAENIDDIASKAKGRIIAATFASNVFRVRELIKIAIKYKRKIVVFGYSMDKIIKISRKIKYLNLGEEVIIDFKDMDKYKENQLFIISTGTQGEPTAALTKMSDGRHKEIHLNEKDTVIFASSEIPGNYENIEKVVNNLIKKGVKLINNYNYPGVHASGHGGMQEQLLMINLFKPLYFFPIHGETVMQVKHAKTAIAAGIKKENIFIIPNGRKLKVFAGKVTLDDYVPTDDIYIDDTNLKGQSSKVITDRNSMSEFGVITITIGINSKENKIIINPEFASYGTFNQQKNRAFIAQIETKIKSNLELYYRSEKRVTFNGIKEIIRNSVRNEIYQKRKTSPIVIPIVLNCNFLENN